MDQPNLTVEFLKGRSLEEWDGLCLELANAVIKKIDGGLGPQILYIEKRGSFKYDFDGKPMDRVRAWRKRIPDQELEPNEKFAEGNPYDWIWHAVPIIEGLVHDAWFPKLILPPEEYAKLAFPNQELVLEMF